MVGPMPPTEPAIERRAYVRVPVRGEVVFRDRNHDVHGRVVSLSEVGLEIRCQLGFSILAMAGPIDITVTLDDGTPLHLTGRVQFVRAATRSIVIAYDAPAPALAEAIESRLAASRDGVANLQLMMLTRAHDERERSAIADEALGRIIDERRRQEPS
jgi:hypothetical protein